MSSRKFRARIFDFKVSVSIRSFGAGRQAGRQANQQYIVSHFPEWRNKSWERRRERSVWEIVRRGTPAPLSFCVCRRYENTRHVMWHRSIFNCPPRLHRQHLCSIERAVMIFGRRLVPHIGLFIHRYFLCLCYFQHNGTRYNSNPAPGNVLRGTNVFDRRILNPRAFKLLGGAFRNCPVGRTVFLSFTDPRQKKTVCQSHSRTRVRETSYTKCTNYM